MTALLGAVFLASLVGSLHCAGMCGPFVIFYAGSQPAERRMTVPHVAYNAGRLLTYLALGATAGAVGSLLDLAGELAGLQRVAGVVAGGVMIAWGVVALLRIAGVRLAPLGHASAPTQWLGRAARALRRRPPVVRAWVMGALTTLLPCGWLYAFAVTSAGAGSAGGGALVMGAFWLGTVPMLLGVGLGASVLAASMRRHLPVVSAVAIVVVGLVAVTGRARLSTAELLQQAASASSLQGEVHVPPTPSADPSLVPSEPSCHARDR